MTHAEQTMQTALERITKLSAASKSPTMQEISRIADEALLWAWDDERPAVGED